MSDVDQLTHHYGAIDAFHGDLMGLHAQFIGIQEEIDTMVAHLGEVWQGSAADAHAEWHARFAHLSAEVQQAAAQAFSAVHNEVGSGGAMQAADMAQAAQFM